MVPCLGGLHPEPLAREKFMRPRRILMEMVGTSVGGGRTYIRHFLRTLPEVDKKNEWFVFVHPKVKAEEKWDLPPRIKVLTSRFAVKTHLHRIIWQQIYLPLFVMGHRINAVISVNYGLPLWAPCQRFLMLREGYPFDERYCRRFLLRNAIPKGVLRRIEMAFRRCLAAVGTRRAHVVMFPTRSMFATVKLYFGAPKRKRLINWFAGSIYDVKRSRLDKPKGEIWLVYVTLWTPYKNFETIIRAMPRILNEFPNAKLMLTIDLNAPHSLRLKRLIEQLNLGGAVVGLGMLQEDGVASLLSQADVFLYPSVFESFGHSMVEAMRFDLPIVASDMPTCREVLDDAAIYATPFSPEEFADRVIQILRSDSLRERLSRKAQERSLLFDWATHVNTILGRI